MPGQRDVNYHPHPIYDMPGFGIDALSKTGLTTVKSVVVAKSGDFTSNAIAHGTNGFEIIGVFASGATSVKLEILNALDSDALLYTYTLTPDSAVKYFTFYDTRLQISAYPSIKFRLSTFVGQGGTVAVNIRPTA